jgi:hypothetical protein
MNKHLLSPLQDQGPDERRLLVPGVSNKGIDKGGFVVVEGQLHGVLSNQCRVAIGHGLPPQASEETPGPKAEGEERGVSSCAHRRKVINHLTDPRLELVMDERLARLVRINQALKAAFEKRKG